MVKTQDVKGERKASRTQYSVYRKYLCSKLINTARQAKNMPLTEWYIDFLQGEDFARFEERYEIERKER